MSISDLTITSTISGAWDKTRCLILFLMTKDEKERFDSRVLYQSIERESKKAHTDWMSFAHESGAEFERWKWETLDIHVSPEGEEYMMLTNNQAILFLLYSQISEGFRFHELDFYLFRFRRHYPFPSKALLTDSFGSLWLLEFVSLGNSTLEEILKKRKMVTEKSTYRGPEKKIELALGERLEGEGITVRYQVQCEHGIADIVTPDAIYEIKASLTKKAIHEAIGQVLAYRACINPSAKAVVVGRQYGSYPVHTKLAESTGVEIIVWQD